MIEADVHYLRKSPTRPRLLHANASLIRQHGSSMLDCACWCRPDFSDLGEVVERMLAAWPALDWRHQALRQMRELWQPHTVAAQFAAQLKEALT